MSKLKTGIIHAPGPLFQGVPNPAHYVYVQSTSKAHTTLYASTQEYKYTISTSQSIGKNLKLSLSIYPSSIQSNPIQSNPIQIPVPVPVPLQRLSNKIPYTHVTLVQNAKIRVSSHAKQSKVANQNQQTESRVRVRVQVPVRERIRV
ncbi:predicted protein [Sclerotinia sclerotiorum 1980 UF-70]|uniref:Uncharacterized protein n=1 Tax=Sclerotinia sclerotiorum (strain ATCC 18683 / 1980 / Ss-1) TaxID=665079 RepID=A7EWP5_SCLS1|nr:predicted protein [Sclerotinia sclerotiorum 1980 UF-70]EDN93887.1 predicted protein [Sclerotinia sclerotiorum 1980 UF-70]